MKPYSSMGIDLYTLRIHRNTIKYGHKGEWSNFNPSYALMDLQNLLISKYEQWRKLGNMGLKNGALEF